jgi:hypothetical protein
MSSRDEAVARLASITGLSIPVALELLEASGGNVETALELSSQFSLSRSVANPNYAAPPAVPSKPAPSSRTSPEFVSLNWVDALKKQASGIAGVLEEFENRGSLFTDSLFPADRIALGSCHGADEVASWQRPRQFLRGAEPLLFKDSMAPSDVIQGRLQNCWFLGALSIAASKPGLMQQNIEFAWVHAGVYTVRFRVVGDWIIPLQSLGIHDTHACPRPGGPSLSNSPRASPPAGMR